MKQIKTLLNLLTAVVFAPVRSNANVLPSNWLLIPVNYNKIYSNNEFNQAK